MNLAILISFGFSATLQKLARGLSARKTKPLHPSFVPLTEAPTVIPASAIGGTNDQFSTDPHCALHRPLRVVRVLEAGQPRSHVGRMVISGCMADVCAELDRLVAREAALS